MESSTKRGEGPQTPRGPFDQGDEASREVTTAPMERISFSVQVVDQNLVRLAGFEPATFGSGDRLRKRHKVNLYNSKPRITVRADMRYLLVFCGIERSE